MHQYLECSWQHIRQPTTAPCKISRLANTATVQWKRKKYLQIVISAELFTNTTRSSAYYDSCKQKHEAQRKNVRPKPTLYFWNAGNKWTSIFLSRDGRSMWNVGRARYCKTLWFGCPKSWRFCMQNWFGAVYFGEFKPRNSNTWVMPIEVGTVSIFTLISWFR